MHSLKRTAARRLLAAVIIAVGRHTSGAVAGPVTLSNVDVPPGDGRLDIATDDFGFWATGPSDVGDNFDPGPDPDDPAANPGRESPTFMAVCFLHVGGVGKAALSNHSFIGDTYNNNMAARGGPADFGLTLVQSNSTGSLPESTSSVFTVTGGGVDIRIALTQTVQTGDPGPDGEPTAFIDQTYALTNQGGSSRSLRLLRHIDADMLWAGAPFGSILDDIVGVDLLELGFPQVFSRDTDLPTAALVLATTENPLDDGRTTGFWYYLSKGAAGNIAQPPGHPTLPAGPACYGDPSCVNDQLAGGNQFCPRYGFGTDFHYWERPGVPNCWKNHLPGRGHNVPGESPAADGDVSMGLQLEFTLAPGATYEVTFRTVYGVQSLFGRVCKTNADCDDLDSCNGVETCDLVGNACLPGTITDCNNNDVADFCDIPGVSEDVNENGVPDECEEGACCANTGACSVTVDEAACDGSFQGSGVACDPIPCSPPANDNCSGAFQIIDGGATVATFSATTGEPSVTDCDNPGASQVHRDVWYNHIATCNGELTVSTCGTANFDTKIAVYDGCSCLALPETPLGCNDDTSGCALGTSDVTVLATQGDCHLIRVGGAGETDVGSVTLGVTCTPSPTGACCDRGNGTCQNDVPDFLCAGPLQSWMEGVACDPDPFDPLCAGDDCNGNGVSDDQDIANQTSQDCNANAVPDECDLGAGTSLDCNGNTVPDECDLDDQTSGDCNSNDVPDECDLAVGTSEDCNGNTVPDECDIVDPTSDDCNANGIPDECDPDCNSNGIADECDISDCTQGDPACDDCNNNGVPDECDIAGGPSLDIDPQDGVPDECSKWVELPGGDEFWGTPENWLPPVVPDNLKKQIFSVTLGGGGSVARLPQRRPVQTYPDAAVGDFLNVIMNIDANIDSLRMRDCATLNMSLGNLTIETSSGILNGGNLVVDGDHRIDSPDGPIVFRGIDPFSQRGGCTPPQLAVRDSGVVTASSIDAIEGALVLMSGGATLDVIGEFTILGDGIYQEDPEVAGDTSALLTTGSIQITTDQNGEGGQVFIGDAMSATATEAIFVGVAVQCKAIPRGGCTPPRLGAFDGGLVRGGSMVVSDGGLVEVASTATIELSGPMTLEGRAFYQEDPNFFGDTSSQLSAGSILITTDDSGEGGQMILTDMMGVTSDSNIFVGVKTTCSAFLRGGCTPPRLGLTAGSSVASGGMLISDNGLVEVDDQAAINLSHRMTLEGGGLYHKGANSPGDATARLTAGSVLITTNDFGEGGQMVLNDHMFVGTDGDFELSQRATCSAFLRGGCTPPRLAIFEFGEIQVGGSFIIGDGTEVIVGGFAAPAAGAVGQGDDAQSFLLGGDFDNRNTNPLLFNWSAGSLSLQGVDVTFEVAGQDRGVTANGFGNNFAMGRIEVVAGAAVTLADNQLNSGNGAAPESLYVDELTLRADSATTVDGVTVYYVQLNNEGTELILVNGGQLVQFQCAATNECDDRDPCTFDVCTIGTCSSVSTRYGDVAGPGGTCGPDGDVALVDILAILDAFSGEFADGCETVNTDIAGDQGSCDPNDSIDLSDILAVLDAFEGRNRCCANR